MKKINLFITVLLLSFLNSCNNQLDSDFLTVKTAIDNQNRAYEDLYNNKQVQKLAELHTINAIVMPPNSKMVKGREEIMNMLNDEVQLGEQDIKFETLELIVSNDIAYETGLYNLNVKPKDGEPFNDKGKYIVIWKKDSDSQWLMEKDIWNSDLQVKKN